MLLGSLFNSGKAGYTWLFFVSSVEWKLKWTLKSHAIKHNIVSVLALHCNVGLCAQFFQKHTKSNHTTTIKHILCIVTHCFKRVHQGRNSVSQYLTL